MNDRGRQFRETAFKWLAKGATWQSLLPLVAAVGALFLLVAAAPVRGSARGERTVRLEASQYRFDPGVVRVNRGEKVTIELVATDVVHGLYLDGYALLLEADPGQTARVTFVADRAGTFRFRCSISCGAMHPFMIGKLQVGNNRLFWSAIGLAMVAVVVGLGLERGKGDTEI